MMLRRIATGLAAAALALAGCSGPGTPSSAKTATVTVTAPAVTVTVTPTTTAPATFDGKPADFKIGVKILKKACFGSAGCNVTYRIVPEYVGLVDLPTSGTVEVTYVVKGLEDQATNTFTIEGGNASYDSEELGSTASSKVNLTATATGVSFQP